MNQFDIDAPQTRSFSIRSSEENEGIITGIAVPYNQETELSPGLFEKFLPGSIEDDEAFLRYAHSEPIGKLIKRKELDTGRDIVGQISQTQRGVEVATLVKDGVLTKMSVGFDGIEYIWEDREDGTSLITWTKVRVREYSIVEFPQYPGAEITSIRSRPEKDQLMTNANEVTQKDFQALSDQIRSQQESTDRKLALLEMRSTESQEREEIPFNFRSLGEYAHALAGTRGDAAKEMATRAFEGSTLSSSIERPAWLGVLEKRMEAKQTVTNMFTHTTDLPATGNTVEYGFRKSDSTVKVEEQENEGDDLAFGNTGSYDTKTASIKTYGGYGTLSLQAIERATESLLNDLLYDQSFAYAQRIETVTRNLFTETVTANEATPIHTLPADPTVNDWIEALLELEDAYEDTPYVMDGLAVSKDIFLHLANLDLDRKALQFTAAPAGNQGTITLKTGEAQFQTYTVKRVPKWNGKHATGWAKEAIQVKESAGAPLRLQDSNVVDLSKNFAVYGYGAHFAPKPGLIKPFAFSA